MKKIFSLALVACMAISASANVQVTKAGLKANQFKMEKKAQKAVFPAERRVMDATPMNMFEKAPVRNARQLAAAKAAKAQVADTALYVAELGLTYYSGLDEEWKGYPPMMLTPYSRDVHFYNFSVFGSEEQFGWFLGETQVGADTDLVVPAYQVFEGPSYYSEATPTFLMESGEEYYYGIGNENAQWPYAWMAFPEFKWMITKCQMYTTPKNIYNLTSGNNFMIWTWSETGPYYMLGSGIDLTAYKIGTGVIDSIAIPWGVDGMTTSIDSIILPAVSFYSNSLEIGDKLTATVISPKKGIVAQHTATAANIAAPTTEEGDTYAAVVFPIKVEVEDEFLILLSGFSSKNANIGFYADGVDNTYYGDTYFVNGGKLYSAFGVNIALMVNAQINENASEEGINSIDAKATKTVKELRNGQLVIKRGDKEYNALGAEMK